MINGKSIGSHNDKICAETKISQITHSLYGQLFGIFLKKALITCPLSMILFRHRKLWNSDFGTFLCKSQKVFFYKIYLLINIYSVCTWSMSSKLALIHYFWKPLYFDFFIISEQYCSLKTQPFIADKPRISIDISEFKHSYGGFMKIMCRIDAVPHPTQLEMRVGGKIFLSKFGLQARRKVWKIGSS